MADAPLPTIYRVADTLPQTWGEAMRAWANPAAQALAQAAQDNKALTHSQLADLVQARSGIRTTVPVREWISRLLDRAQASYAASLAHTATRVEGSQGLVEQGLVDLKSFCRPDGSGSTAAKRTRSASGRARASATQSTPSAAPGKTAEEAPLVVCQQCFTQLPASGICDYCA